MRNGSRFFIRDHGLHRTNVMIRLRPIHTESGRSSVSQILIKRRAAQQQHLVQKGLGHRGLPASRCIQAVHGFNSMSFPDQHSVTTQSSALCMSPQMLNAILRSSDAAAFSTEDLTRLQDGISQQLSDRARQESHQHQPVRASRGVEPPECIGVSDPYLPTTQPCSSITKGKPIFELNDE